MNLHFQIDPHSGMPVYRQLMEQVRYYVATETLPPGAQLPSIRDLAQRLTVNPTTIVKAYSELAHQGTIEMRHGKGAFVAQKPSPVPPEERRLILRNGARKLVVLARQIGAEREEILQHVSEELERVRLVSPPDSASKSQPAIAAAPEPEWQAPVKVVKPRA